MKYYAINTHGRGVEEERPITLEIVLREAGVTDLRGWSSEELNTEPEVAQLTALRFVNRLNRDGSYFKYYIKEA